MSGIVSSFHKLSTKDCRKPWEYRGFKIIPLREYGWKILLGKGILSRTKAGAKAYIDKVTN